MRLFVLAAMLASSAISSPINTRAPAAAVEQLLLIAPTSDTCSGSPFPDECSTAASAAPYLINAMQTYGINTSPEIAAVLSLIAFETGDFKYNINHYPGRAGQGTRNMMMVNFILQYANSFPELADTVQAITGGSSTLSDDAANKVRALVLPDQYSWASAAWFLSTQCAATKLGLQTGGVAGYQAYLACVGVSPTDDRMAYWVRASQAFGLPTN